MRLASGKINRLLSVPDSPARGEFYLIESDGITKFYLSDSSGTLILLNESSGSSGNPVTAEVPSGTINGSNNSFGLAHLPLSGSVALFLNGLRLLSPGDYTRSGSTLTMINIPYPGDILIADYRY